MRLIGAGVAALLVLSVTPAASADTWTGRDRKGDVRSVRFSDTPTSGCDSPDVFVKRQPGDTKRDIVRFTVDHGPLSVALSVSVRALDDVARSDTGFTVRTPDADYLVFASRVERRGQIATSIVRRSQKPVPLDCGGSYYEYTDVACDVAAESDTVADTLRLTVPRTCLGEPDWVRSGARTRSARIPDRFDFWGRQDRDKPGYPLSPRVRVTEAP